MYCVVGSDNLSFYFIGLLIKRNHNKSDTERKSPMDLEFDAMIDFFFFLGEGESIFSEYLVIRKRIMVLLGLFLNYFQLSTIQTVGKLYFLHLLWLVEPHD